MKIKTKVGSVAKNTLKYIRIQEKFIISSDLKFVSNILSSATIIGAGNRDAGCTVSHCLHTGDLVFLPVTITPLLKMHHPGKFIQVNTKEHYLEEANNIHNVSP